jgi:ketosteroid isomerase-like protein
METFRAALEKHLKAIRERDLDAFRNTISSSDMAVITSDGRLVRDRARFLKMHGEWFESKTWSLEVGEAFVQEWQGVALAVLALEYFDQPPGSPPLREKSYLTLVFAKRDGRWEMVFDQNTPCRHSLAESGS